MIKPVRALFAILFVFALTPAVASAQPDDLRQRVEAILSQAPTGTRFGLVVTDEAGRELVAINPDGRFIPASNTKILTTAAAYATLTGLDRPDTAGTAVYLGDRQNGVPNLILVGAGDARLSSAADCIANCLATLADAVAARTRQVRDVIGDDTLFPDQRWSPGMSWNNIHTRSGSGVSALTIDDNELVARILPTAAGQPPHVDALPYYRIENEAVTVADGATNLDFARMPGTPTIRLTGTIRVGAEPATLRFGIDDPAHYAAWRLRTMLEARRVRVLGQVTVNHRAGGTPARNMTAPPIASLTPPPLAEDIAHINKVSQNIHSELLIRRIGLTRGTNGIDDGVAAIAAMMERAGVPRTGWDLSDGSGMSTYNRVSPRAMIGLLRWIAAQPWSATWRATLPVAGVDGTLTSRFRGTPLQGRLFAKTGTLNATNALSGYLTARSGRTLTFSFFANDVPGGGGVTPTMDAALLAIAEAN